MRFRHVPRQLSGTTVLDLTHSMVERSTSENGGMANLMVTALSYGRAGIDMSVG